MINVKDHGVYGDGVNDDSGALQTLIDNKKSPLYFPPGRYRINSKLTFPAKSGYALFGSGLARPVADSSAAKGAESVIFWGGSSTSEPMIEYQGTGLIWSGLSLWGCNLPGSSSSCPGARAKYGIRILRPTGSPVGTGKVWFDSLLIANCDEAIATESADNLNCDTLAFGYFRCEDCSIGLRLTHANSLQYTFQHVYAEDVGTIFHVDHKTSGPEKLRGGGGRIFTQLVSVQTDDTTILRLEGGGANTGYHQLGGVTLKRGITNVKLLSNVTTSGGQHQVRFTDGHFSDGDTSSTTTAYVEVNRSQNPGGWTTLEFVGCRGMAALDGRVKLLGKANDDGTTKHRQIFFVRDCDVANVGTLIQTGSNHYDARGIDNWTFANGWVGASQQKVPA